MSQRASREYEREKKAQSLDTIAVKNPTKEDVVFWHDKLGTESRKIMVPNEDKDIGHGKGIAHLPRFLAIRYTKKMIVSIINKISDQDWKEKKEKYRTRDEMLQHAEKVQIRTNDRKLWEKYLPQIWLGVVKKYTSYQDLPDPKEVMPPQTGDTFEDSYKKLDLEKPYEPKKKNTKKA